MKARRIFAAVFYILSMAAYAAAGYVSWRAYDRSISYNLGFLWFLPIWIVSYWCSTFFTMLCEVRLKDGKRKVIVDKTAYRILNVLSNLMAAVLLGYWVYVYFFLYKAAE